MENQRFDGAYSLIDEIIWRIESCKLGGVYLPLIAHLKELSNVLYAIELRLSGLKALTQDNTKTGEQKC